MVQYDVAQELGEEYGSILSAAILRNMNIVKKKDVIPSDVEFVLDRLEDEIPTLVYGP